MTYIVGENCIKCKHMDCVDVCPVDCFYEGENTLVINPDECIDCGICEPACPANAIYADNAVDYDQETKDFWYEINEKYSLIWPNISRMRNEDKFPDAEEWDGVPDKYKNHWSDNPGKGDS